MANFILTHHWRRKAGQAAKHLADRLHVDDDILSDEQKKELRQLRLELRQLAATGAPAEIRPYLRELGERCSRIVPPGPLPWLRGWLDLIAVVAMVACGVRGLYFQPFQIPTSSMQPTLYGIHYMDGEARQDVLTAGAPLADWLLHSTRRAELTVSKAGAFEGIEPLRRGLFDYSRVGIGGVEYVLPGVPSKVAEYTHINPYQRVQRFSQGETLADGWLSSGDHLFVDRISFHLTGLDRGDVVVFTTEDIYDDRGRPLAESSGYFYIKRLVGLPGDTLRITPEGLEVRPAGESDFRPITEFSDAFDKLYSGKGGYQKHSVYLAGNRTGQYLTRFGEEFTVPEDSFFMLGDNVMFSSDSRVWGTVPRRNIVGRALVVFWPFSRRWGVIDNKPPLDVPTGTPGFSTFDVMGLQ